MAYRENPAGLAALRTDGMAEFITRVSERAATEAKRLVNVDTGDLRSSISARVDVGSDPATGYVFATKNYAIWQEFEPGEDIPGIGTRRRRGGKAFLRPGVQIAIRDELARARQ
jgi:hypothetical protein